MKKKALSLLCAALALTAVLGAGSVASAAFTDSDQIQYKSAVGVTTGTGIVNGYTDGSFRPKDSITREQAAKLITYTCIGEDAVSRLPREETGFADVSADRWSAPYINWCRQNGLIDGVGGGNFDPSGTITGYQLTKMILRAVGYGQHGEYSGKSWELESAKDGFAKGVFTDIKDSNPSNAVSREDAALYIFNMLTRLEKVSYSNGTYVPADGTATLDNTFGASVFGIITDGPKATVYSGVVTGNSAAGSKGTTVADRHYDYETGLALLGHNVSVYTNGQAELRSRVYYIADNSETITLRNAIAGRDYFEETFGGRTLSADLLVFDENGAVSDTHILPGGDFSAYKAPAGSYICKGTVITAYVPHYEEYAATVGAAGDGNVKIGAKSCTAEQVYFESSDISSGDIVLVRVIGETLDVRLAGSFTSELTDYLTNRDGTVDFKVAGAVLHASAIRTETIPGAVAQPVAGRTYRFYLDSDGAVIAVLPA